MIVNIPVSQLRLLLLLAVLSLLACNQKLTEKTVEQTPAPVVQEIKEEEGLSAKEILGNPKYLAMAYGGYREISRDQQPTIAQIKEDLKILSAMGVKIVRTYNVHLAHAGNLLEAITQLKEADANFEMYVMLGAWINCENAWTDNVNHYGEDLEGNTLEIKRTVALVKKYPSIVKVIAVGNEAMVKWAASYHVQAGVILKWVNYLQDLKQTGVIGKKVWITSSDNFAAWGGDTDNYHVKDLEKLIKAVDYISLHTYPMHETHYFPEYWGVFEGEENLSKTEKIEVAMLRARDRAIAQIESTTKYMKSIGADKPIHIGETGWSTSSNGFYGDEGTKATDEYKEGIYYKLMRDWTNQNGMSCFYFEAFDEIWKDHENQGGSENHFGLFKLDGTAKYALWDLVDQGAFKGLNRGGQAIGKTYDGDLEALLEIVKIPPANKKE